MTIPSKYRQLSNRHVAKLLDSLEEIMDLSELAKKAIKSEFHYLAEDIYQAEQQGENHERSYNN